MISLKKLLKFINIIIFVILTALILISVSSCNKEGTPVVDITETKPSETTSLPAVPETTIAQETSPPTTEATFQTIEYNGSIFTLPEFSEANPQTGEILALVGNPYGAEAGTKIGQCLIDAIEVNGQKENSIAFIPKVIEYLEKAEVEKEKWLQIPIPFDLTKDENKGIKMDFVKEEEWNTSHKEQDVIELNFSSWHVIAPIGAKMLSPYSLKASKEDYLGFVTAPSFSDRNDFYETDFYTDSYKNLGILFKGENVYSFITIHGYGVKLEVIGEKINDLASMCSTYIGEPIFEVTAAPDANPEQRKMLRAPETASFIIYNLLNKQNKNKDGYIFLFYGENMFLNLNNIKVSVLSGETTAANAQTQ